MRILAHRRPSWSTVRLVVVTAGLALGLAVACGQPSPEPIESAVTTTDTVEASTTPADTSPPPTTPTSTPESSSDRPSASATEAVIEPVFSSGIQPILERSCASCHEAGQAGSDHVVLATAGDAVAHADEIELVVRAGVMPPWPASSDSLAFVDDRSLTLAELDAVLAWIDDGASLDVDPATPIVSSRARSYIDDPDVVMTSAGGPFSRATDAVDDYRCLVFEPGNTSSEWILASHLVPDQEAIVHHGIITLASSELRDEAATLDEGSPGPGWTCYGGTGLERGGRASLQRVGGWAPGAQPDRLPDGYAIPLEPGDFFVVQIHYHFDGPAQPDLSEFVLDLASADDLAAVGGSFEALDSALYLGPAEIPCYEGDPEPLCDRDAALDRVRSLYGPFIGALPDFFLRQCGATVGDFTEMTDGTAWSTCDLPVSNPGHITSVTGHMHELGLSIRLTLNPDTDEELILLDIPDWDFEWQLGYEPVDDIVIDRGDVIRVECAWNRERAPYEAVGYILWSDGTSDEMCYSSITTAPVG